MSCPNEVVILVEGEPGDPSFLWFTGLSPSLNRVFWNTWNESEGEWELREQSPDLPMPKPIFQEIEDYIGDGFSTVDPKTGSHIIVQPDWVIVWDVSCTWCGPALFSIQGPDDAVARGYFSLEGFPEAWDDAIERGGW